MKLASIDNGSVHKLMKGERYTVFKTKARCKSKWDLSISHRGTESKHQLLPHTPFSDCGNRESAWSMGQHHKDIIYIPSAPLQPSFTSGDEPSGFKFRLINLLQSQTVSKSVTIYLSLSLSLSLIPSYFLSLFLSHYLFQSLPKPHLYPPPPFFFSSPTVLFFN